MKFLLREIVADGVAADPADETSDLEVDSTKRRFGLVKTHVGRLLC